MPPAILSVYDDFDFKYERRICRDGVSASAVVIAVCGEEHAHAFFVLAHLPQGLGESVDDGGAVR